MNEMNITSVKYLATNGENHTLECVIDGNTCSVPIQVGNRHYDAIMKAVEAGDLTIADAD